MINERDKTYYDWLINKIEPKKLRWKLYCRFRKMITISESPSKIQIYENEKVIKVWKEEWEELGIFKE